MSRAGRSTAQRARRNARRKGRRTPAQISSKQQPAAVALIVPKASESPWVPESVPFKAEVSLPNWQVQVRVKNRRQLTRLEEDWMEKVFDDFIHRLKGKPYWLTVVVTARSARQARSRARETVRGRSGLYRGVLKIYRHTKEPLKRD